MNAGKWLIVGIFAVAIGGAVAAWVHRYYRTDAVQALWGEETLDLIANAPRADIARRIGVTETARRDATRAKGMLNVRYMLGSDFAYDWAARAGDGPSAVAWELEFVRGNESVVLDFNEDCTLLHNRKSKQAIHLVEAAATNLRSFFEEQFQASSSGEKAKP